MEFAWQSEYDLESNIIMGRCFPSSGVMDTTMSPESLPNVSRQVGAIERFDGNHGLVALFSLTGGLLLALVAFVIVQAAHQFPGFTLISAASGVFGLGSLIVAGLFLLYAAREAAASFFVDDEGIRRHAWGRSTAIAWRDLVGLREFAATGRTRKTGKTGRCVLYDRDGRRLAIPLPWLVDGSRLRNVLEPHLVGVRAAQLRDLARDGGRYRPERPTGVVVLAFMTPLFLICGLTIFEPAGLAGADDSADVRILCVLSLVAAPLLALLGVELCTRELAITTEGLSLTSLFLHRSIPFDRIESISVKVQNAEEPVEERAKVRGNDGQTIAFASGMPEYRAILSLLESRAAAKLRGSAVNDPEFS